SVLRSYIQIENKGSGLPRRLRLLAMTGQFLYMRRRKRHIVRTLDDAGIVHCKSEFVALDARQIP
ncbi:MAG: hypothetical protein IJT41_05720, partial [Clostridia bacterium]|nr:hypothetical protein [Clostridia bacterium]